MKDYLISEIERIRNKESIPIVELEKLLISNYKFLDSKVESEYNICLSVICHVASLKIKDPLVQQILYDNVIKSRIFLYNNLYKKQNETYDPIISVQDNMAQGLYTSFTTETILTRPQKEIFDLFMKKKRLIVSAPTSFGKTRIIREILSHSDYQNIVLITPTVSLLSEMYRDLKDSIANYVVAKSSKIEIDGSKKYILIFTPERMNMFLQENPNFQVNFFSMDEIYKVDYKLKDDRFQIFTDILYKLSKTNADFYLIGPYISNFSEKFRTRFKIDMKIFNIEIVQKDYYNLDVNNTGIKKIENENIRIIQNRFENLKRLITNKSIDGKYLIYRYQKQYVEDTALKLSNDLPEKTFNEELVHYLSETVSSEWSLISCIKKGIAFHHGAVPRHIQDLVVDEFNDESPDGINYLFCTTSLTEGVNTSAKNVVLYDSLIGQGDPLKGLDKRNIEGRAGRFMRHFIGRVFYLTQFDQNDEDINVEIESFDKDEASPETLVQVDREDLTPDNQTKKAELESRLELIKVPIDLIRKNKYVNIEGQLKLIEILRKRDSIFKACQFQSTLPGLETFKLILLLSYESFFTERDKGNNFKTDIGKEILLSLTSYYLYYSPSFKELLNSETIIKSRPNVSSRVRYVFDLISKYFEFIWPKYLIAFENIYNFVAQEKKESSIDFDMTVAKLEYGTIENHEILLKDAGVPNNIIKKVSKLFNECVTYDDILRVKRESSDQISSLVARIEKRILEKYL